MINAPTNDEGIEGDVISNYSLQELKPLIIQWANERNLIHSENAEKQRLKLIEESGELASAILKNDIDLQRDSIGDVFVVLTILEAQLKTDFEWVRSSHGLKSVWYNLQKVIESPIMYSGNLKNIAKKLNHDLTECANLAYSEIKNRKGKTINGNFIKA
ncbi:MAG: MazG-like family protein [Bacteroidia bacterium]